MTSRYIADACALIVFLAVRDPERIMRNAAPIMRGGDVQVSPITVWEISRKVALGKLPAVWGDYPSLSLLLRAQGFVARPLAWDEAEQANRLPQFHQDPMDRMLIATALRHDLTIITDDAGFAQYGVTTVW